MSDYLTITPENVREVPLACIIRKKPGHPGIEAKRAWLAERVAEGHVFRKLRDPASCAFIEYAPLETAWVPVEGKNYLYIYCLWVAGDAKGHGHGALPSVFNNFAVFWNGQLITVNQIDPKALEKVIGRSGG